MRKKIIKRLVGVTIVVVMFATVLNCILHIRYTNESMVTASQDLFWQIRQTIAENEEDVVKVEADYAESCLNSAKAAAYIIQKDPSVLDSQEELDKIKAFLQVDEIHIFNEDGLLYAGSEPKYYNYTFNSGEQIQFFLPMLVDKSLELCQEITPNTAEEKLMQYSAVWNEEGTMIVQIGMEPLHVMAFMEKNELSYIFSLLTEDNGVVLYAADPDTGEILGSTDEAQVGLTLMDIGLEQVPLGNQQKGYSETINGKLSYCYFERADTVILGRICTYKIMYQDLGNNILILGICLLLVAIFMVIRVIQYLDVNIVNAIADVNNDLKIITAGNLDARVEVRTTPEFEELSGHINEMVESILGTTDKISQILDNVEDPIGVFEYGAGMKRVRYTSRVPEILELSLKKEKELMADYTQFDKYMDWVCKNPIEGHDFVYRIGEKRAKYVKVESIHKGNSVLGMLMDVTDDILKQQQIELERDVDMLTGLMSRRALYANLNKLFVTPEKLKCAVMIMLDSDNLKKINDIYGHEAGDRYLSKVAECLRSVSAPKSIIARLSGDEFVMFIYDCENISELNRCIDDLRRKRGSVNVTLIDGTQFPVQYSFGCAYCPIESMDYHELLKNADDRMYEDKRNRKREQQTV